MRYLIVLIIVFRCFEGIAQGNGKMYMSFSYTKLTPGKRDVYLNLIHNYSPKITAARIRMNGGVLGWYMYEVRMPSGAQNDHDFVSLTMVSDFNMLFDELNPPEGTMEKLFPGISSSTINGVFETYESSRTVLRKEITYPVLDIVPSAKPSKAVWVDYVKAGEMEKEFLKNETETLLPVYKDLIAKGLLTNVKIYRKTIPVGPSADFDFIVTYSANSIANVADGRLMEALKKLSPAKSVRKIVQSEIWELVEYVDVDRSGTL